MPGQHHVGYLAMTDLPEPMTRQQLLDDFAQEWDALLKVVDSADDDALLSRTDTAGWNARDHLAHLITWLQGVTHMLREGKPQHVGMGIPAELYSQIDYDPMNEAIRERTINWSFPLVVNYLRASHEEIVGIVSHMSDEDLLKPVNDFVEGGGDFAICYKIDGNGPYHYREHRGWIEVILNQNDDA